MKIGFWKPILLLSLPIALFLIIKHSYQKTPSYVTQTLIGAMSNRDEKQIAQLSTSQGLLSLKGSEDLPETWLAHWQWWTNTNENHIHIVSIAKNRWEIVGRSREHIDLILTPGGWKVEEVVTDDFVY